MFKCEECGVITQPGERMNKKTVERRPRSYGVKSRKDFTKEAEGFEIVKEISICTNCAKRSK